MPERRISLAERLQGKRVCVCVGAGGVGKTTISAAIALGLAASGRRALVVSIDPARRLATALGLNELPGEPHRVSPEALAAEGVESQGELWAMMLDPKATFDELIGRLAPDERSREEVLANRIYHELSTATAGSQEFTAVAKLYELEREHRFDAIVLDTPPSRNALDFLDAPDRLTRFLEGRALRALLRPGGLAGGLLGRGGGIVFSVLARVTGVNLLGDLSTFFRSLGGLLEGFSERARGVEQLLRDARTSFVIVASPEAEPIGEAVFFHARLLEAGMPFGALVVNHVHETWLDSDTWPDGDTRPDDETRLDGDTRPDGEKAPDGETEPGSERGLDGDSREQLEDLLGERIERGLASRLAQNLADFDVLARRDRASVARLERALGERQPLIVPQLDGDVHDLAGLALVAGHLFS